MNVASADASAGTFTTLPCGVRFQDTTVGAGTEAEPGQVVHVHYTGWLDAAGDRGRKFDSSRDRNKPFSFALGAHQVIAGWDLGVAGMQVGAPAR